MSRSVVGVGKATSAWPLRRAPVLGAWPRSDCCCSCASCESGVVVSVRLTHATPLAMQREQTSPPEHFAFEVRHGSQAFRMRLRLIPACVKSGEPCLPALGNVPDSPCVVAGALLLYEQSSCRRLQALHRPEARSHLTLLARH